MGPARRWRYEPDENPKKKHAWGKLEAGFVRHGERLVGKCPSDLSNEDAERLLNEGIPEIAARPRVDYPARIWAIHDGVLYKARPTNRGKSYHGCPASPDEFERLDDDMRDAILQRARELGQERELRKWLSREW